jgi:uncharacterized OB-fold protein
VNDAAADGDLLHAPLVIEYGFMRTTGPVIGAFLTALREQRVLGIRGADGRVVCPPVEYDPSTGAPLTEMVEVGTEGTITSWSWVSQLREGQPLDRPHALAMIQLDGADTAMLHVVDAPGPDAVSTGARVRIRWADERQGLINDIACFELTGGAA